MLQHPCFCVCKMIVILNDSTGVKKMFLKEGSLGGGVLGHISEKDVVPRNMEVIVLKTDIFVFAFKNSEMSIIEHR